MKAILTIIFILFSATFAMAQSTSKEVKVETMTQKVNLDITIDKNTIQKAEVARLYMYKNSRIKKELGFKTKNNSAKMA